MSRIHSESVGYVLLSSALVGGVFVLAPQGAIGADADVVEPDDISRPAAVVEGPTQRVGADNTAEEAPELKPGERSFTDQQDQLAKQRAKQRAQRIAARFPFGRLKSGFAVPLKKFRVGPLFGRVGGPHSGGVHSGLDLGAPANTPVRSASDGRVIVAAWQGAAGKAVTIKTETGHQVLYGHLNQIDVKEGQKVTAGEVIGLVGSTGNSTGPHLHIGVHRKDGTLIDPMVWLKTSVPELVKQGRN